MLFEKCSFKLLQGVGPGLGRGRRSGDGVAAGGGRGRWPLEGGVELLGPARAFFMLTAFDQSRRLSGPVPKRDFGTFWGACAAKRNGGPEVHQPARWLGGGGGASTDSEGGRRRDSPRPARRRAGAAPYLPSCLGSGKAPPPGPQQLARTAPPAPATVEGGAHGRAGVKPPRNPQRPAGGCRGRSSLRLCSPFRPAGGRRAPV